MPPVPATVAPNPAVPPAPSTVGIEPATDSEPVTVTTLAADVPAAAPVVVAPDAWTARKLLAWMAEAMKKNNVAESKLCAELLLTSVLKCDRMKLYTDPDRLASAEELATLRSLVARALKQEPVQYLIGETYFFSLKIKVDPRVLIPRHCTETLVEHVLQHVGKLGTAQQADGGSGVPSEAVPAKLFKRGRGPLPAQAIADICTGSGCIALALAKNLPGSTVLACDVSAEALAMATENARSLGLDHAVRFAQGDLLAPLGSDVFDIITANPPYIPDGEWDAVPDNVKRFEPTLALRGGADGLQFVRPLIQGAAARLRPGGLLAIELASATAPVAQQLAQGTGAYADVHTLTDLDGHQRVLVARRR